jgi:hypothetical protein
MENIFNIKLDEDTTLLLECVNKILISSFKHECTLSRKYIEQFYYFYQSLKRWGDEFYHSEGAIRVAVMVHYTQHLKADFNQIYNYNDTIETLYNRESIETDFIKHYGQSLYLY